MGILDKKNMLRILIIVFGILIITSPATWAEKIKFFEDKVDFFSKKEEAKKEDPKTRGCSECDKNSQGKKKISSETQTKIEEIQQYSKEWITKKEKQGEKKIILFIGPACKYSDAAVNTLVRFKKDNPDWIVEGVIEIPPGNIKNTLLKKTEMFQHGIDFSIDIAAKKALQFGLDKIPTYVIALNGKLYKIAGVPNLTGVITKITK